MFPGIKSNVFSGRKVIRELLFSMLRPHSRVREVVAVVAGGVRDGGGKVTKRWRLEKRDGEQVGRSGTERTTQINIQTGRTVVWNRGTLTNTGL